MRFRDHRCGIFAVADDASPLLVRDLEGNGWNFWVAARDLGVDFAQLPKGRAGLLWGEKFLPWGGDLLPGDEMLLPDGKKFLRGHDKLLPASEKLLPALEKFLPRGEK